MVRAEEGAIRREDKDLEQSDWGKNLRLELLAGGANEDDFIE